MDPLQPGPGERPVVEIEFYAGYRGEERPVRIRLGGATLEVSQVLEQWRTPEGACFRVRAGDLVLLLRENADLGLWTAGICGQVWSREAR
ncbi:MAG: hypothetical protein N2036_15810 [Bryobacteraceae bacterium]|nr:hypothetical protein [Bryobacteraceae bacterium]